MGRKSTFAFPVTIAMLTEMPRMRGTRIVTPPQEYAPTPPRPAYLSSIGWPVLPWLLGGVFILVFMLRDYLVSENGVIAHSVYWGRDFINVWTGGQLIADGRLATLYDLRGYVEAQRAMFGDIGAHNYSYPPISFPIALIFGAMPYGVALAAWIISTGLLFIAAARPFWPPRAGPAFLAILTPAALVNIWAGHYGFLIGALFLFGWRWLDERPVRAGVFFGLMAIKPHLAVLVPFVLLLRRDWTAIASAAATTVALVGATTLVWGWQPWHDFLFRTTGAQAEMIDAGRMFFRLMSPSVATAMFQLGAGWPVAAAVQAASSLGALILLARAVQAGVGRIPLALLVATATFLFLPYAFNYDLTVVMIGALAMMTRDDQTLGSLRFGLVGFFAPQAGMCALAILQLPLMPVMLWVFFAAQMRQALADARTEKAPSPASERLALG
jgi:alpha-1,2-mannosyltransferase